MQRKRRERGHVPISESMLHSAMDRASSSAPASGRAVRDIFTTDDIFQRVLATADEETSHPTRLLFLSGLAAGMAMGATFLGFSAVKAALPSAPWAVLLAALAYPLGFAIIVLGRYQLFTENTLTPVTLVLTRIASLPSLLHVWVVVLAANVIGAGAAAYFFAKTGILEPGIAEAARAYGLTALERPWMDLFWRALFAGGLVATMVWMTHAARETVSRLLLVFLLMFLVPAAHLYHCISGTVEGLFVVFDPVARAPLGSFVWGFFAPVVAGNTVGGLFLVALLNYAQTRKSQFPGRDGPMQLTWPEWLGSFGLTWHAHPGETPVAELADEVDEEQDRILGRPGCPVTLVQYGDYGAPATRLIFELVEEVLEDPETEVSYVYRHLPLKRDHSPSERAAAAAEAAGRQGRFWEMHSQLLRNHDRLDRPHLLEYAQAVDLEMDRFRRDLDDPELLERVLRQRRSGIRSGVRWAANLFINGYRYQGAMEIRGIREAVREASKLRLASEVEEPESHGTD